MSESEFYSFYVLARNLYSRMLWCCQGRQKHSSKSFGIVVGYTGLNIAYRFIGTPVACSDYIVFERTVAQDSFGWIFMKLKSIRVAEIMA
jgi:hypothetical protein